MTLLIERARAKINLTLTVLGRRPDGYHELDSLVAFADVADIVTLRAGAKPHVAVTGRFAPSIAGENLVRVALDKLASVEPPLTLGQVTLEKNLPVAAGIGGGSADAAAVLRAVRAANPERSNDIDWPAIATKLGADVPVCFANTAALMRGSGETVTPVADLPTLDVILVNPLCAVPHDKTRQVFARLGAPPLPVGTWAGEAPQLHSATDVLAFMRARGNDLTDAACAVTPLIAIVLDAVRNLKGVEWAAVSGGGPTCFAVFSNPADARNAAGQLTRSHPAWWVTATHLS